jgi:hypothetical protein
MKRNTALAIFAMVAVPLLIAAAFMVTLNIPQVYAKLLTHGHTPSPNQNAVAHACFVKLGHTHPPPFCK